jgi:hypothetical protein
MDVVFAYTRQQAITDGVLVEVPSSLSASAGFTKPVALTAALHSVAVRVPVGAEPFQDESGRLWDLLWMLRCAIGGRIPSRDRGPLAGGVGEQLTFQLHVITDASQIGTPPLLDVKCLSGPADDGSPCLTLMLPEED